MEWKIVESGKASAVHHMETDTCLFEKLSREQTPILHFYEWEERWATHGIFVDPSRFIHMDQAERVGIKFARRPTGGGIIFHLTDFAFSVIIPSNHKNYSLNTLQNYAFVNAVVCEAIKKLLGNSFTMITLHDSIKDEKNPINFCMAHPSKFDILVEGKKLGGAAQRRTKGGFLHQGSLLISPQPLDLLKDLFKPEIDILEAMKKNSYSLLDSSSSVIEITVLRKQLRYYLKKSFLSL